MGNCSRFVGFKQGKGKGEEEVWRVRELEGWYFEETENEVKSKRKKGN